MSSKTLVMLGAGGHAKVCYEIAREMKKWDEVIVLDDNPMNDFFEISGKIKDVNKYPLADFFVAIGDNNIRSKVLAKLFNNNNSIATLIHPGATISPSVTIGHGTVLMAGVVINANTHIGMGCILNTACTIDHDNLIQNYVHISPGVHTAGSVKIDELTWIGIGSTISNNVHVTASVKVGAGGLIINDILESGAYIGSPVKKI